MDRMTHNLTNPGPKIALFEPDIPQNTAAIIRTCACLGAKLEIIEPCGFLLSDKRFKRIVMDYMDEKDINFYQSADVFFDSNKDLLNNFHKQLKFLFLNYLLKMDLNHA